MGSTSRIYVGTTCFLLYINYLNSVFNKAKTIHFADNTYLSSASKKLSTIESIMNYELKKLTEWLRSNKVSRNSTKSELATFRSKTKKELDEITMKINKSKLSPVLNVNYLGLVLDEFLSWNAHINNLSKKLTQANGILSNYIIMSHKIHVLQYISPCFIHLLYTAPKHGKLLKKPILTESSFCKRNAYA